MALAWHLQERRYGGLKPLVQRRLEALANAYRRGKLPAALLQACSFRPGTTLVKLWRGRRHTVIALPYGFCYQGKIYRSLTAIAREITGTHRNGAAFFGLRDAKGSAGTGDRVRLRPRCAGVQPPPMVHQQATCASEHQAIAEPESGQRAGAGYFADSSRESADRGLGGGAREISNPRDPSGLDGRNSSRVWHTIRPEKKASVLKRTVRQGFGGGLFCHGGG